MLKVEVEVPAGIKVTTRLRQVLQVVGIPLTVVVATTNGRLAEPLLLATIGKRRMSLYLVALQYSTRLLPIRVVKAGRRLMVEVTTGRTKSTTQRSLLQVGRRIRILSR